MVYDRSGSGPAVVLLPDRIPDFFSRAEVKLLPGVGHFVPIEAPQAFASVVQGAL